VRLHLLRILYLFSWPSLLQAALSAALVDVVEVAGRQASRAMLVPSSMPSFDILTAAVSRHAAGPHHSTLHATLSLEHLLSST
jgi:hypothetical protein